MARGKTPQQALRELAAECRDSFKRWDRLYHIGGSDPFWPDGVNLNLVRNHIIYYKRSIEELCTLNGLDMPILPETPPEVDGDYMARADEIRENAKKALIAYKQDPNYQSLCKEVKTLTEKQKDKTSITSVIWYAKGLEKAIVEDDLVDMRRSSYQKSYLQGFKECLEKVIKIKSEKLKENEQISWF